MNKSVVQPHIIGFELAGPALYLHAGGCLQALRSVGGTLSVYNYASTCPGRCCDVESGFSEAGDWV
ncbi:MAG: hypothetical protein LUQ22_09530 [Methanotrichaceae archaeon]|nr:hypothetical protein [Methanotrichaceae archaeon]